MKLSDKDIPLCVDLDGTLIKTDCLHESILIASKKRFYIIFLIPIWLITGGIALVKEKVMKFGLPKASGLPYDSNVINYIKEEKKKGRKIILATASMQEIADSVSEHTGLFDLAIGTTPGNNLRRGKKLEALEKMFGKRGFDYIGNSYSDLKVWEGSRYAILANTNKKVRESAESKGNVKEIFESPKKSLKLIIKEIRIYQWIKNILIFIPFLLAHKFNAIDVWLNSIIAFFAFSFTASSVYLVNDLLDLESDRNHPTKKKRPFASGELPVHYGVLLFPIMLLSGYILAFVFLERSFLLILTSYFILTTFYSFYIKKVYVLDLIFLAGLYTIRLVAGSVATDVIISPWLFSFSIFLFLSFAIIKRYTEINTLIDNDKKKTIGRGYITDDKILLLVSGVSSGLISILIFILYLSSPEVKALYSSHQILYLITPLLLYWILRIWFKTERREMNEDPVIFMAKDKTSYLIFLIIGFIVYGATI